MAQPQPHPAIPTPLSQNPDFQLQNDDETSFFQNLLNVLRNGLGENLKGVPNPEKLDVLQDVEANYFPTYSAEGSSELKNPMLHHKKGQIEDTSRSGTADIALVEGLEAFLQTLDDTRSARPAVQKFLSYYYGAFSLKAMDRFLDTWQSDLREWPSLGGADIGAVAKNDPNFQLHLEWLFRSRFVRILHYPGLYKAVVQDDMAEINNDRLTNVADTYVISRLLLEREHLNNPALNAPLVDEFPYNDGDPREPEMRWIKESRRVVEEALEVAFTEARTPIGPAVANLAARNATGILTDDCDRVEANVQFTMGPLLDMINQRMDTALAPHPFERLALDLLDKENTFEKLMSIEHIDDKLITKQVSLLDEEDISRFPFSIPYLEASVQIGEKIAARMLSDIGLVNRQRRNWRLLKDWQPGHRPWKKMYQIYDSSIPENSWLANVITEFLGRVEISLENNNMRDMNNTHPTSYHSLAIKLFDVLPVDLGNDTFNGSPRASSFKDCYICKLPFTPQGKAIAPLDPNHPNIKFHQLYNSTSPLATTVMELNCGHIFHVGCIINYWDEVHEYTHTCPQCKKTAKLNWELASLNPFEFTSYDDQEAGGPYKRDIFAHNTYAHNAAKLQFSENNQELISKELYDLPADKRNYGLLNPNNPTPRNPGDGRWLDRIAAEYWAREHTLSLAYEYEPIQWRAMKFEAGARATARPPGGSLRTTLDSIPLSEQFGANLIPGTNLIGAGGIAGIMNMGRVLGDRWMEARYQPFPDQPDYSPDVYDIENVRILSAPQRPPRQVAAELRRTRRIRARAQRAWAARGNQGTI